MILSVAIILLLLFGLNILQTMYHSYNLTNRWKEPLHIGILSDMGWNISDTETFAWTDISPDDWKVAIKERAERASLKVVFDNATVDSRFDRYSAILNPYGSVYPEADVKTLSTMDKIVDYVSEGGLFVSVADIPCYFAYDKNLGRRLDSTQPIYVPAPVYDGFILRTVRPFEQAPLPKELGLQIINLDHGMQLNLESVAGENVAVTFRRAVLVERNVESCVPNVELQMANGTRPVSPIFLTKYAKGDFLISLIWVNDETHNQHKKNALKMGISGLVVEHLKSKRATN